jgi:hypothetical protein
MTYGCPGQPTALSILLLGMGMFVDFRLMAGMIVVVGPMITIMIMHIRFPRMRMLMQVFMEMLVGVFMPMLMAVFRIAVGMFVLVFMVMRMSMKMLVFMLSFHKASHMTSGVMNLEILPLL